MKLNYNIAKKNQEKKDDFVPICNINISPNIILSPEEQQILQQLMSQTWDYFCEEIVLPRLKREKKEE